VLYEACVAADRALHPLNLDRDPATISLHEHLMQRSERLNTHYQLLQLDVSLTLHDLDATQESIHDCGAST
jgi:hypothetical protein